MSDRRTELAAREAAAWARFEAALDRIPRDRWSDDGVLPGWTVKDLVWHVAGWLDRCGDELVGRREGTFVPQSETDEEVDARNAAFAAAAREMDTADVHTGLLLARERVQRGWESLPEIDDAAVESYAGETYEHYEEHVPDLERFAG
jgi:uncharacterized damage-inducible protein DinB